MRNSTNLTTDPKIFAAYALQASKGPIRTWIAPYRALVDRYLGRTLKAPRIAITPPRRECSSAQILVNRLLQLELDLCRASEGLPWFRESWSSATRQLSGQLLGQLKQPNPPTKPNPSARLITQSRTHWDDEPANLSERLSPPRDNLPILRLPRLDLEPVYWSSIDPAARLSSPVLSLRRELQSQLASSLPNPITIDPAVLLPLRSRAKYKQIIPTPPIPYSCNAPSDLYRDFPQLLDH